MELKKKTGETAICQIAHGSKEIKYMENENGK